MQPIKHLSISMLILFTLIACTTMQPLNEDLTKEEIFNAIEPGDELNILTKTGDQHSITVSVVTEDYIIGGGKQFKIEDVERIEIKKISSAGTAAGTVGGVVVGVGLVYLYYLIIAAISVAIVGF